MKLTLSPSAHDISGTVENIIFDFGGVICTIDVALTEKAFRGLGMKPAPEDRGQPGYLQVFSDLEEGLITPPEFRDKLRRYLPDATTDQQIDDAWNALLLDIPPHRITLIEQLKQHYRIFLLSNSNAIHFDVFNTRFARQFGYPDGLTGLFEHTWFSYRLRMKKPDPAIFHHVTREAGLSPRHTLFIDDTLVHVEGARQAGLQAHHLDLTRGEEIGHLFSED